MDVVAWLIFAILAPVSLLHFLWGCGMTWPGRDAQELSTIVVGVEGAEKMPGFFLTLIVAIAIFAAALWPLFWRGLLDYPHAIPQTLIWLGMWGCAVVFLMRGLGGYIHQLSSTVQPFARLNRAYYSPLCILLGLGFLALVLVPIFP